ncbi:DUF819 family protein [Nitriliruptor alkaliphilus]|uniref:DUF819 family protein n=1 Tax=Nitriliruptor alkaliphilus TaxID=427918 RepID=UPI000697B7B4|nr:DUF819 family protein [Nitriliruptor alkaliphilus]
MGWLAVLVVALATPALAIVGARRWRPLDAVGPVVVCYAVGVIVGNLGLVPTDSPAADTASLIRTATVVLAIPLLLLGTDLRAWARLARPALISFGLAIVSVVAVTVVLAPRFDLGATTDEIAGMTVGVYTGGTANMAAIGTALDVPEATFVALNAADLFVGALYLLVLLSVAQRLLARVLPAPVRVGANEDPEVTRTSDPFAVTPAGRHVVVALAMGLGVVLVVAGTALVALTPVVTGEPVMDSDAFATAMVLGITTLALALSFVRRVREQPGTYVTGQYLFLVFAVAIGTLANLADLAASFTTVVPYIAAVLTLAVLLHVLLARLLRIDHDTAIITSTAAVFGPPFVGPVAAALRNPDVVPSGMTTGVLGLALGNYVGLAVAALLR